MSKVIWTNPVDHKGGFQIQEVQNGVMDILGKEGEKAKENVEHVSDQLESLESHLNAVDKALQDFMAKSESILVGDLKLEEGELKKLEELQAKDEEETRSLKELDEEVEMIKRQMRDMRKTQQKQKQKLNVLMDSELLDIIDKVRELVNTTNKRYYDLRDSLGSLENRLNELENDFIMEVNNREYDFDKKLDERRFEEETEELENEISKLRASLNMLSDEVDDIHDRDG